MTAVCRNVGLMLLIFHMYMYMHTHMYLRRQFLAGDLTEEKRRELYWSQLLMVMAQVDTCKKMAHIYTVWPLDQQVFLGREKGGPLDCCLSPFNCLA